MAIQHLPETAQFYLNERSGVAILITGSGKTAAALTMAAVLNAPGLDFTDAYIVSVGCSGGSYETTTLGDVVLVTAACERQRSSRERRLRVTATGKDSTDTKMR